MQPETFVDFGVAIELEATPGVWDAPTMAGAAVRLANRPTLRWEWMAPGGREGVSVGGYGIPPSAAPRGRLARLEAELELVGSGTAGTAPRWTRILETFNTHTDTATENDFTPAASTKKALSVLFQDANKEYQLRGAVPERLVIRGPDRENRIIVATTLVGAAIVIASGLYVLTRMRRTAPVLVPRKGDGQ